MTSRIKLIGNLEIACAQKQENYDQSINVHLRCGPGKRLCA